MRKLAARFVAVGSWLLLTACAEDHVVTPDDGGGDLDGPVSFAVVAQGGDTGYTRGKDAQARGLVVITEARAWATFWTQHTRLMDEPAAMPDIDFSSRTVLAVVDSQPTISGVTVEGLESGADTLSISVTGVCTGALIPSWPFHIVAVDGHRWTTFRMERSDQGGGNSCIEW